MGEICVIIYTMKLLKLARDFLLRRTPGHELSDLPFSL